MTAMTVKSREARSRWRELLDQVLTGNDVLIERNGKPVAVMIPVADYEGLQAERAYARDHRPAIDAARAAALADGAGIG